MTLATLVFMQDRLGSNADPIHVGISAISAHACRAIMAATYSVPDRAGEAMTPATSWYPIGTSKSHVYPGSKMGYGPFNVLCRVLLELYP